MNESTSPEPCGWCSSPLPPRAGRHKAAIRYCGEACRIRAYYAANPDKRNEQRERANEKARAAREAAPPRTPCVNCGTPVHNSRAMYCMAPACRDLASEADKTRKRMAARVLYDADRAAGAARIGAIRSRYTAQQKADRLKSQRRWRAGARTFVSVTCAQCGDVFQAESKTEDQRRYCTVACSYRARAALARERAKPKPPRVPTVRFVAGSCLRCGAPFIAGWNGSGSSRYCSKGCSNAAGKERREALLRGAFVAEVDRAKIYERDDWCCGICGMDVDMRAKAPSPMSPSLDHVIPLAKGGTHEPKNCQLAHFICNSIKGDRLDVARAS